MRLIIENSKTKRELEGGFRICGSKTDLTWLAQQILNETEADFLYGWIDIVPPGVLPERITNEPPASWD